MSPGFLRKLLRLLPVAPEYLRNRPHTEPCSAAGGLGTFNVYARATGNYGYTLPTFTEEP